VAIRNDSGLIDSASRMVSASSAPATTTAAAAAAASANVRGAGRDDWTASATRPALSVAAKPATRNP
jgi:hypothetical protein